MAAGLGVRGASGMSKAYSSSTPKVNLHEHTWQAGRCMLTVQTARMPACVQGTGVSLTTLTCLTAQGAALWHAAAFWADDHAGVV